MIDCEPVSIEGLEGLKFEAWRDDIGGAKAFFQKLSRDNNEMIIIQKLVDAETLFSFQILIVMRYEYNEGLYLDALRGYIRATYEQHYNGRGGQVFDLLESSECMSGFLRGSIIKYIARYGKKGGRNKLDLMKAAHCIIILMYSERDK